MPVAADIQRVRARARDAGQRRVGGGEHGDRGHTHCCRQVRESRVDADDDFGAARPAQRVRQRHALRYRAASVASAARRRLRSPSAALPHGTSEVKPACAKCASSPRQRSSGHSWCRRDWCRETSSANRSRDGQRAWRRRRWHPLPAWRPGDGVAECGAGQRACLVDEMLVARDTVMHIVEPGGQRLADAVAIEAMATPARQTRDHVRPSPVPAGRGR